MALNEDVDCIGPQRINDKINYIAWCEQTFGLPYWKFYVLRRMTALCQEGNVALLYFECTCVLIIVSSYGIYSKSTDALVWL